jgi:hypothetical protein
VTLPYLARATVTVISAIVSFGFSIAAVSSTFGDARTLALYASARSFALLLVSAVTFAVGSVAWLEAMAWCMIVVQSCDARIGITIKEPTKNVGPATMALLNLAALLCFFGFYSEA